MSLNKLLARAAAASSDTLYLTASRANLGYLLRLYRLRDTSNSLEFTEESEVSIAPASMISEDFEVNDVSDSFSFSSVSVADAQKSLFFSEAADDVSGSFFFLLFS